MSKPERCRQCDAPLTQRSGTGRPRAYCSPLCRRVAEYDIRRLQGHLTRAEREHQRARLFMSREGYRADEDVTWWAAEVERLRVELRELLVRQGAE